MSVTEEDASSGFEEEKKAPNGWFSIRYIQAVLLFFLIFVAYGIRSSFSVAIVAMTDSSVNPSFPYYEWNDKSILLSSFFWGYIIPQIGAGQVAEKFGPKWFLVITMCANSAIHILIPFMAELGSWGVMLCRIVQGLTQGFVYPSCHNLLGNWSPLSERSRMGNFVYAGGILGTAVAMPVTGWIAQSDLGWPSSFYLYGGLGLAWTVSWAIFGANTPDEHKTITEEEKRYIKGLLEETDNKKKPKTPWKSFFTSVQVWALLVTHCGQNWGFWTLSTEIPSYMSGILNFNISKNGLLSACPYLIFWVLTFVFSIASDFLINRKYLSVGVTRKLFNSIGLYCSAAGLLTLGVLTTAGASTSSVLAILLFSVGINAGTYSGYQLSHIDLSPNFAGTLMGITNAAANVFSLLGPLVVQFIVTDDTNSFQWSLVFYIAAGVYVVTNTVFIIFVSGELQPWDSPENEGKENHTEMELGYIKANTSPSAIKKKYDG